MTPQLRRLAPMAAWNAAGWLAAGLYAFVVTRLVIENAGEEAYGVWATIGAVRGFIMFLDGGLAFGVNRDAARHEEAPIESAARVRAARRLYAALALLCVTAFVIAAGFPVTLLALEGTSAGAANTVMVLIGIETGAALLGSPLAAMMRGRQRFDALASALWAQTLLGTALLAHLTPRYGLVGAAAATLCARIAVLAGTWAWVRARGFLPERGGVPRSSFRAVLGFAAPLWLVAAGTQLAAGTDIPVVGALHGATTAGQYALGAALPAMAAGLLFAILGAAFPRLVAAGEAERHRTMGLLLFIASVLSAAGFGLIALHEEALLTIWVGRAPDLAISVAAVMCVCWTINAPTHVLVSLAIARDAHRFLGLIVLAEATVNLGLSIYLVIAWSPLGPAVATLLAITASNGVVIPTLLRRRLGLRWAAILKPIACGLGIGVAIAGIVRAATLMTAGDAGLTTALGALLTLVAVAIVLDMTVRGGGGVRFFVRMTARGGWRIRARQRREVAAEREYLERVRRDAPIVWGKATPPLVTVRIATYDRGRLVADRAIASALAQTHANIEVVVVGDHCDDATARAVLAVRDPRVRFVNLPRRGRYPSVPELRWMVAGTAPMNHALDLARGQWIAALDDDDEFLPDHVEVLLDACRSRDLEFVYGVAEMEGSDGTWGRCGSWPLRHGSIVHASAMWWSRIRLRHDIEAWRLDEPGDWNVWHRMRDAGVRMGFVDRVVTRHYEERRDIMPRRPFFLATRPNSRTAK